MLNSRRGELSWDGTALSGYQLIENNTKVYLYLLPEQPPLSVSALKNNELTGETSVSGRNASLVMHFPSNLGKVVLRYGVSFIDEVQARKNLEREVAEKSLESVRKEGRKLWNDELGKIKVSGGTEDDRVVFYTSLYRTFERPVSISEDGRYFSAFDGKVHVDSGRPFYTDDWIWDSYRAHHPLRVIIDPKREEDILNSFVLMAGQMEHFWMPTFPEITGDSRRMNSNHGIASVLDAHMKGLGNFDLEKAYLAGKGAVMEKTLAPWSGKPAGELDRYYREHGYIPALREGERRPSPRFTASTETACCRYTGHCLRSVVPGSTARELGRTEEHDYFMNCSFNYRNLFHPETKFSIPRTTAVILFNPSITASRAGWEPEAITGRITAGFTAGMCSNIPDLIDLMGGADEFIRNLDQMFAEPLGKSKYEFFAQLPDHTGNVGQFSMANEPSLHIPYLYNYAGAPWKTQKRIRDLIRQWFRNDLMGLPGDEDGGGMSSFVVFSQMGFYPVTPGLPGYSIGSPFFDRVEIDLGNGKIFEIEALNNSPENKYIQSATLNGKALDRSWIEHEEIAAGGRLVFVMGNRPNREWGLGE